MHVTVECGHPGKFRFEEFPRGHPSLENAVQSVVASWIRRVAGEMVFSFAHVSPRCECALFFFSTSTPHCLQSLRERVPSAMSEFSVCLIGVHMGVPSAWRVLPRWGLGRASTFQRWMSDRRCLAVIQRIGNEVPETQSKTEAGTFLQAKCEAITTVSMRAKPGERADQRALEQPCAGHKVDLQVEVGWNCVKLEVSKHVAGDS